ncbi:hypothetical protein HYY75_00900 [bacterium]|nr:hypothetical protein [bacterium]
MYRLTSLGIAALKQKGISNFRSHLVIIKSKSRSSSRTSPEIGTMLISLQPFSSGDFRTIETICKQMKFDMMLTPTSCLDPIFEKLTSPSEYESVVENYPMNLSPPTDDSPFFFHMVRLQHAFRSDLWDTTLMYFNSRAIIVLIVLTGVICCMAFLCILLPVLFSRERKPFKKTIPLTLFFGGIGLGYMLVEISLMQKLIIFLGHPTYGLSVVLFALLISSGLGSYSTEFAYSTPIRSGFIRLPILIFILSLLGIAGPKAISHYQYLETWNRMVVAVIIIFPAGFFMGMAFPLGMKLANETLPKFTPWFWGINGAASISASVLGTALSITSGISATFYVGLLCYLLAFIGFCFSHLRKSGQKCCMKRRLEKRCDVA